jgi:hypothetical protein
MATLSMSAAAAIGAPCNRRSGRAASCAPQSTTSRWRRKPRPGRSRRQRRRGQASGRCRGATAARPPPGTAPRPAGAPPMRPASQPGFALPPPAHFPARRRPLRSGAAGAVKAGARGVCAPPAGRGLDRRSPPSRYTLSPPGRAGVSCRRGAPGSRRGTGTARSERKPRAFCGWSARRSTLRPRSAGAQRPSGGLGAPSPQYPQQCLAARRRGCPTQP